MRLVLTLAVLAAIGLAPAAMAAQTTGTNDSPGVRATESATNTGTDQTNMGTYRTGPGHPAACGPGTNGRARTEATNGPACNGYGSSVPPRSGAPGQR